MAVCQNLVPLVNIKIAGKWMFIPLKMVLIGIDPYPYGISPMTYRITRVIYGLTTDPIRDGSNRPPEPLLLPGAVLGGPETLPLFRR
jgi:hypothetical protein